jgi:ComF family protein
MAINDLPMPTLFRDLIFTPTCICCQQLGTALCGHCANSLVQVTQLQIMNISDGKFAHHYSGWLRDRLIEYKSGNYELARGLAEVISAKCLDPKSKNILVPIPTTAEKIRLRGIDTVGHLAKQVKLINQTVEIMPILRVTKVLTDQVGLTKAQRIVNLSGAFRSTKMFTGDVILIDDVVTTGATLGAAALALKHAGANTVKAVGLCAAVKMH